MTTQRRKREPVPPWLAMQIDLQAAALDSADTAKRLQAAMAHADPVAGLVILDRIAEARALADRIAALYAAAKDRQR